MSKIEKISTKIIKNSRGEETIEVTVETDEGHSGTASVPTGKSRGKFEAVSVSATTAKNNIEDKIAKSIIGLDPKDQENIDDIMLKLDGSQNKEILGGNTILGVSLATAKAGAKTKNIPLWQHIEELNTDKCSRNTPRLLMNLINGGLHAENNLDFQEYLVIPKEGSMEKSLEVGERIYKELLKLYPSTPLGNEGGVAPDFNDSDEPLNLLKSIAQNLGLEKQIDLGIDAAASNVEKDHLMKRYLNLLEQHQNLIYIEDPFPEENFTDFAELLNQTSKETIICGDDLTVTNTLKIKEAEKNRSINGIIIKPNQIGTLTETLRAIKLAKQNNWKVIVAHRSGDTEDDFIADLAFGVSAWGLKAGAPGPEERMVKYLRLKEIEQNEL